MKLTPVNLLAGAILTWTLSAGSLAQAPIRLHARSDWRYGGD